MTQHTQHPLHLLTDILGRAQNLASSIMMGDPIDTCLAEEVSGELSEFMAHLDGDRGSMDEEAIDPELRDLAQGISQALSHSDVERAGAREVR